LLLVAVAVVMEMVLPLRVLGLVLVDFAQQSQQLVVVDRLKPR
jgi:hypothetical protein